MWYIAFFILTTTLFLTSCSFWNNTSNKDSQRESEKHQLTSSGSFLTEKPGGQIGELSSEQKQLQDFLNLSLEETMKFDCLNFSDENNKNMCEIRKKNIPELNRRLPLTERAKKGDLSACDEMETEKEKRDQCKIGFVIWNAVSNTGVTDQSKICEVLSKNLIPQCEAMKEKIFSVKK